MSQPEQKVNQSPWNRSNLIGYDDRPQAGINNAGAGITPTLTKNIFNRSFPDGVYHAKKFNTFMWAPMKVIGQGVKNIQGGTKETETYVEYKVGDVLALKIKNRPKVYESRIGDLKIRIQCSLDLPPHGHVNKFIDAGEYVQFINQYKEQLAQAMGKTMYELFRFFFLSSAFSACLPSNVYDQLLLKTLTYTNGLPAIEQTQNPFTSEVNIYSPLFKFLVQHREHFKALSDEMNKKITNKFVFDVADVIHTSQGGRFDPFVPGQPSREGGQQIDGMKRLAQCLISSNMRSTPEEEPQVNGAGPRISREKSLKAFEIVLATLGEMTEEPSYMGGQGNCGNVVSHYGSDTRMGNVNAGNSMTYPMENERYPSNAGTNIMDKPMGQRPMMVVECRKEDRILVMSLADYRDFTSGAYKGYFGSESMAELNGARVADKYAEIITIPDMPCGHALILDKRMIAAIPHLEKTGTDTLMQRLATVDTMHKGGIFGLFDQFVGMRIQMVGYTGAPIDMQNIFFQNKDVGEAVTGLGV